MLTSRTVKVLLLVVVLYIIRNLIKNVRMKEVYLYIYIVRRESLLITSLDRLTRARARARSFYNTARSNSFKATSNAKWLEIFAHSVKKPFLSLKIKKIELESYSSSKLKSCFQVSIFERLIWTHQWHVETLEVSSVTLLMFVFGNALIMDCCPRDGRQRQYFPFAPITLFTLSLPISFFPFLLCYIHALFYIYISRGKRAFGSLSYRNPFSTFLYVR